MLFSQRPVDHLVGKTPRQADQDPLMDPLRSNPERLKTRTLTLRRTGDAGRGSGRREYFDMERGAGGGAGERALEQVFK